LGTTTQTVAAIARGYPYKMRLWVSPVSEGEPRPFPEGCSLLADVAVFLGGPAVASLSTESGTIVRIDDDTIELTIPGAATALLTNTSAQLDLVRTDPTPDEWLGLQVSLPVVQPVTAARLHS
jgi:hypothetical protein